jgi:hypothetical protein
MSEIIPAIGAISLGIVIAYLFRYFITRFKKFAPSTLSSVISIIAGGAVVKFLGADKTVIWCYPIGLLLGLIGYRTLPPTTNQRLYRQHGADGFGIGHWAERDAEKYEAEQKAEHRKALRSARDKALQDRRSAREQKDSSASEPRNTSS